MNWITTNLRIPEDVYMDLKMQAARERKSVAAVIRERITKPKESKNTARLLRELRIVSKKIEKQAKGLNLTKALIESRYEHI